MKIKPLLEEFKTSVLHRGETFEIFYVQGKASFKPAENKLLNELAFVRFALDLDRDRLYVWDVRLLHLDASRELDLEYTLGIPKFHHIWGEGKYDNGKITFSEAFSFEMLVSNSRGDTRKKKNLLEYKDLVDKSQVIDKVIGIKEYILKGMKRK